MGFIHFKQITKKYFKMPQAYHQLTQTVCTVFFVNKSIFKFKKSFEIKWLSFVSPPQAGVPNLYEGDLTIEEEVLDWLIEMKVI